MQLVCDYTAVLDDTACRLLHSPASRCNHATCASMHCRLPEAGTFVSMLEGAVTETTVVSPSLLMTVMKLMSMTKVKVTEVLTVTTKVKVTMMTMMKVTLVMLKETVKKIRDIVISSMEEYTNVLFLHTKFNPAG